MNTRKRSLIGAILTLIISGVVGFVGSSLVGGSAQGAAAMNRVTMTCGVSPKGFDVRYHRQQVDSIVANGQPQSAHMHDFFGRTDISSTMNSNWPITPGHEDDPGYTPAYSTCLTYGDWAAYWFPTPKFNDAVIQPGPLKITWQSPAGTQVATPPFGETFVSGNAKATAAGSDPHVRFTCGGLDEAGFTIPTDCSSVPGGVVTAEITFPDCWDGFKTFDTPAGISPNHFSYSTGGSCAQGSAPMAQLVTQQQFIDPRTSAPMVNPNVTAPPPPPLGLSFSSGPYYTYHGDYINTWNHVLGTVVNACLNHDPYWVARSSCPTVVNNVPIQ
jgi:hypothetical protein